MTSGCGQVHLREEESALLDPTLAALGWTDELEAAHRAPANEALLNVDELPNR